VRLSIHNKNSRALEQKFSSAPHTIARINDLVERCPEIKANLNAWSTEDDPSKKQRYCSFNADYVRDFYSNETLAVAHALIVQDIFSKYRVPLIQDVLKIESRHKGTKAAQAFMKLEGFLVSDAFKAQTTQERRKAMSAEESRDYVLKFKEGIEDKAN
jgi:hypothetical protein